MSDNVIELPVYTRLDIPAERVLKGALDADLEHVIIIGETEEDFYLASSTANKEKIIFLLEMVKHKFLNGEYDAYEKD